MAWSEERSPDSGGRASLHAWPGVAAVAVGMGIGHLAGALTERSASPVAAVSARVVDMTPSALKNWAVSTLGNLDKPVLTAAVALVALGLGALIGRLLPGRPRVAWGLAASLCVSVFAAALAGSPTVRGAVPPFAASVAGAATLLLLNRTGRAPAPSDAARRRLLLGVSGAVSLGLLAGVAGELIRPSTAFRVVTLPNPARRRPALPDPLPIPGIEPLVTPQSELYRVDINVTTPEIDVADWRLDVDGMVDHPYTVGWDDLVAMEIIERDATLMCVSNLVGGSYIGTGRWLGVRTKDLLRRASIRDGADMVLSTSWDSFTVSTPLDALLDDREALVAIGFNGELLTGEHGYPARLLTPGLYGFVGATKWLRRLTVTRFADRQAYWTVRGWADRAPMKLSSRIDTPRPFRPIAAGRIAVGGSAWASRVTVAGVEVRIDGGPWRAADLGSDPGLDVWRQWATTWDATPGKHVIECRARAADGTVQSEGPAEPDPDGAEGYHAVRVEVSA